MCIREHCNMCAYLGCALGDPLCFLLQLFKGVSIVMGP
uniref:Uncharacterized protein n=1 Tax=Anguilla anguilla TaxID=7936 RepID=A0A0E9UGW9_ANGAN